MNELKLAKTPQAEIRRSRFVHEFVKNGGNGTQAVLSAGYLTRRRGGKTPLGKVASITSAGLLQVPSVRQEIINAFSNRGMTLDNVMDIHYRNLSQTDNISASQTAVRDYYRLAGLEQRSAKVQVKFNISE